MKAWFCLLLIYSLAVSGSRADVDRKFFQIVYLDRDFPEIFVQGEVFVIEGSIINFPIANKVVARIDAQDGSYSKMVVSPESEDGRFRLPIPFERTGSFLFSLLTFGRSGETLIIKVIPPMALKPCQPFPIIDASLFSIQNHPFLQIQSKNNLYKITFRQDEQELFHLYSGNLDTLQLIPSDFKSFHEGTLGITIQGAVSKDGTLLKMQSDWGDPRVFEFDIIQQQFATIKYKDFSDLQGIDCHAKPGETIRITGIAKRRYFEDALVITPDYLIERVKIKSSGNATTYTIGRLFPENSHFAIEYIPQRTGTYILEMNDQRGLALINIPIYVGEATPLLPDHTTVCRDSMTSATIVVADLAAIVWTLQFINQLRNRIGLEPLILSEPIAAFAQQTANQMKTTGNFSHNIPGYGDLEQRRQNARILETLEENFAYAPSVEHANFNLARSPGHYKAIINPKAKQVGIGIEPLEDAVLVVQHFAALAITDADCSQFTERLLGQINRMRQTKIALTDSIPEKCPIIVRDIALEAPSFERVAKMLFNHPQCKSYFKNERITFLYINELKQYIDGIHFSFTLFGLE
ncbi:CAP domain-containing protein [candidate division KSB1 bacterium]|nr:CAP domain-containing protein [candidate division KSB1 bacterium]